MVLRGHLRASERAVDEHDRDLAHGKPGKDGTVGDLDLEYVPFRADARQIDGLQPLPADALEASGQITDVDAESTGNTRS